MARLITTGFETGDTSDIYQQNGSSGVFSSSPTPRTGSYGLQLPYGGTPWMDFKDFPGTDVIYMGVAIYNSQTLPYHILQFMDSSDNVLGAIEVNANYQLYVTDGSSTLATATLTTPWATWYYMEVYFHCADAGHFVVKVNGVEHINFSGDTKRLTSTDVTTLRFRGFDYQILKIDDLVVNDDAGSDNNTYPGVIKLYPIRPNAAGDVTGLSRGGTDSGSNYGQVDEVPANSADYVYDTIVDDYDLYNTATVTLESGYVIKNVVVVATSYLDSGTGNIALMVKSGSTESTGASQAINNVSRPYQECWHHNPADSADWEQADIDSLQIGVKVK